MLFSIGLLIVVVVIAFKISPKENKEHAHVHGAGQIGLLAAVALFGVDYFTSYLLCDGRDDERAAPVWATRVCLHCSGRHQPGELYVWRVVHVLAGASSMKAAVRTRPRCGIWSRH